MPIITMNYYITPKYLRSIIKIHPEISIKSFKEDKVFYFPIAFL